MTEPLDDIPLPRGTSIWIWLLRLALLAVLVAVIVIAMQRHYEAQLLRDPLAEAAARRGCVRPAHGMRVDRDTVLCGGLYFMYGNTPDSITITGDNVQLLCRQTRIIGNRQATAIRVKGRNALVAGCLFVSFAQGIVAEEKADGLRLRQLRLDNVSGDFVRLAGTAADPLTGVSLQDLWLARGGIGVVGEYCRDLDITHNHYLNDDPVTVPGFQLTNCVNTTFLENIVFSIGEKAPHILLATGGSNLNVQGNTFQGDGTTGGIVLAGTNGSAVHHNKIILNPNTTALALDERTSQSRVWGNIIGGGAIRDASRGTLWCVERRGNLLVRGATYAGPDPHHGSCPP